VLVVGVDGCPAGWVAVAVDPGGGAWAARVHGTFVGLLGAYDGAVAIGVDVPIGLAAEGTRRCDGLARARLGPRRASVFTPPSRRLLELTADAADYREANRRCRAALGHGIGAQAFNIYGKIREVDALMVPERQRWVREVHPELCFAAMRGAPCDWPKRTPAGAQERWSALQAACPWLRRRPDALAGGDGTNEMPRAPAGAALDDLLDAMAAAWTAARVARGTARTLPDQPEIDPRGRRMEMVF
jgi:predicted RNase H-like nuclease